jgi:hypothetical protein
MLFPTEQEDYKMLECMNIYAKEGTEVVYGGFNGYDSDRVHGNTYLNIGQIYTVNHTDVGQSHTNVYLTEFPNERFNSVLFYKTII